MQTACLNLHNCNPSSQPHLVHHSEPMQNKPRNTKRLQTRTGEEPIRQISLLPTMKNTHTHSSQKHTTAATSTKEKTRHVYTLARSYRCWPCIKKCAKHTERRQPCNGNMARKNKAVAMPVSRHAGEKLYLLNLTSWHCPQRNSQTKNQRLWGARNRIHIQLHGNRNHEDVVFTHSLSYADPIEARTQIVHGEDVPTKTQPGTRGSRHPNPPIRLPTENPRDIKNQRNALIAWHSNGISQHRMSACC